MFWDIKELGILLFIIQSFCEQINIENIDSLKQLHVGKQWFETHKCYMNEIDRQTESNSDYFTQLAWLGQNDSRKVAILCYEQWCCINMVSIGPHFPIVQI